MKPNVVLRILLVLSLLAVLFSSVTPARAIPAEINKSFNPTTINPGGVATMTIRLFNPNPTFDLTNAAFTDNLPAGMFIAGTPNVTNSCGGNVTATGGGTSLSLSAGTIPQQVGPAPGECTITVDITSTVQGNLINTIPTGALTTTQGETNSTDANATLTVRSIAALSLAKLMAPNTFFSGATSRLTIRITNNDSTAQLTNVSLTDAFPPELSIFTTPNIVTANCGSPTVTATPGTTQLAITGANINPGQQCNVTVTVTQTAIGAFTNDIPANSITSNQGVTNTSNAFINYSVQANVLNMTKNFTPNRVNVGAPTTLAINLANPNPVVPATAVNVTDNLPAGVVVANPPIVTITNCGAIPPTVTANPGDTAIVVNGGTVPPSTTCIIRVNVTATTSNVYSNTIPPGNLTTGNGFSASSSASANITFNGLSLGKSFAASPIQSGSTTRARITLTNPGTTDLVGLSLTDNFPGQITIASPSNPGTTCPAGTVTATPGTSQMSMSGITVPAGGSCFIEADVTSSTVGTWNNSIPADAVRDSLNNIVRHPAASAPLGVVPGGGSVDSPIGSKSFSTGSAAIGAPVQLRINVQAPGGALAAVAFTDTLPAGMVVANPPGVNNNCGGTVTAVAGSGVVSLSGGSVAAGTTCRVLVFVMGTTASAFTNTMGAGSITATAGGAPVQNVAGFSAGLTVNASISASKTFTPATINANGTTTMRIQINAPPGSGLANAGFSDTLPAGMIVATPNGLVTSGCGTPTVTAVSGSNSVSMTGATLAPGGVCRVDVNVAAPNASGVLNNSIPIGGLTGTFDSGAAGQNTSAVSQNLAVTGLTVSKAFAPTTIGPNGRSTLIITLRNFTSQQLTNLSTTDNLPVPGAFGIQIANPSQAATTCGTGTVTAAPGTTTITLTGGQIQAQVAGTEGICTIVVDVVPSNHNGPYTSGSVTNTIPTGGVTSAQGVTNPAPASAVLSFSNLTLNLNKSFNPLLVSGGGSSILTLQVSSPSGVAIGGVSFTDNLPAGMIIFLPPALTTTNCGSSFTTTGITPGSNSFSFSNIDIPANQTCTITMQVTSTVSGNRTNTIPANSVTSQSGATNPQAASASLTYTPGLGLQKLFTPPTISPGGRSTVTIQIINTNSFPITNVNLTDTMPAGVTIASPVTTTNACGGTVNATAGGTTVAIVNGNMAANATCQFTVEVTASAAGTYTNDIPPNSVTARDSGNNPVTNTTGISATLTVSLAYSLGNRVWFDANNNGLREAGETPIGGVTVNLRDSTGTTILATTTTDANGYYRFDNLLAGQYVVEIPASNFGAGGQLNGRTSSTGVEASPDADVDDNDNGIDDANPAANGIRSGLVTLGPGTSEPVGETDSGPATPGGAADNQSNLTVDFGFFAAPGTSYSLGNRVWFDANNNGLREATETPIGGVTVNLRDAAGTTILATTTTDANGYYRFDNLVPGQYVVEIPASNFATGAPLNGWASSSGVEASPDADVDDNDNGIDDTNPAANGIRSGVVTLGPGTSEPTGETDTGPATPGGAADNQSNLTVDFGFYFVGAPGGTPGTGAPIVGVADPVMVKLVDPVLAQPGEEVRYNITVTNHGTAPASPVIIRDPVPDTLIVVGAVASQGTFTISNRIVTFNVGTLNPGQQIVLTVIAQVSPNIKPPLDLTNTATLNDRSASATLRVTRGLLPATGQRPANAESAANWIAPVLALAALILVSGLRLRRLRRESAR